MLDKAQLNFFSRFSPSKHKPISSLYYSTSRQPTPKGLRLSSRNRESHRIQTSQTKTPPKNNKHKEGNDQMSSQQKHIDYSFRETPRQKIPDQDFSNRLPFEQLTFRQRVEARLGTANHILPTDKQQPAYTDTETQEYSVETVEEESHQIFKNTSCALTSAIKKLESAALPTTVKTKFLKIYKNIQKQLKSQSMKLAEQKAELQARLEDAKVFLQLQEMMGIGDINRLPDEDDELTWNKTLIACFVRQLVLLRP